MEVRKGLEKKGEKANRKYWQCMRTSVVIGLGMTYLNKQKLIFSLVFLL